MYNLPTGGDRLDAVNKAWRDAMPCKDCSLEHICKYASSIKRPDYNPEVFTFSIECAHLLLKSIGEYVHESNG